MKKTKIPRMVYETNDKPNYEAEREYVDKKTKEAIKAALELQKKFPDISITFGGLPVDLYNL